jgi:hypothetical protein
MSRIQSLDEITHRLGPPALLRCPRRPQPFKPSSPQLSVTQPQLPHTIATDPGAEPHQSGGLAPHAKRAIRDLLQQHLHPAVSVPELAEASGLNPHHFIKAFRHTEGFTLNE